MKAIDLLEKMLSDYNYYSKEQEVERVRGEKEKVLYYYNCAGILENYISDVAELAGVKIDFLNRKLELTVREVKIAEGSIEKREVKKTKKE